MIDYSFRFEIGSYYEIQVEDVGRIDLIAMRLYNSLNYTVVIRACNRIGMPFFCRSTLRPVTSDRGDSWSSYDHSSGGMITELYQGRRLAIPTLASANEFLKRNAIT